MLSREYTLHQLTQTDTTIPKIYGLPKLHKPNIPLRLVVCTIGSPTYSLAKEITSLLTTHRKEQPKSYIKNNIDLINKIKEVEVPDGHILVSFDVKSLFTNVPKEKVLNSLEKRYKSHWWRAGASRKGSRNIGSRLEKLKETSTFLMDNLYFQFDKKIFRQKFGTPMGLPVSPIFADLVMEDLENDILEKIINQLGFSPLFFYRYVDDIIACIPANQLKNMLDLLNSYDPRLQFTYELETEKIVKVGNTEKIVHEIPFLDVLLIRDGKKIITNWHRKCTSSGRVLNFKSSHPLSQKRAMVYTLVDKAILLSHQKFHCKNLKLVTTLLLSNNYPRSFIYKNMQKRMSTLKFRINNSVQKVPGTNRLNRSAPYVSVPHVPGFYHRVSRALNRYRIRTGPKLVNNFGKIIVKGKDKNNILDSTNLIYKGHCTSCPATYVGQTMRPLHARIKEHFKDYKKDSPLAEHDRIQGHNIDWENFEILHREKHWFKRRTVEMIFIKAQEMALNRQNDTDLLPQCYNSLVPRYPRS